MKILALLFVAALVAGHGHDHEHGSHAHEHSHDHSHDHHDHEHHHHDQEHEHVHHHHDHHDHVHRGDQSPAGSQHDYSQPQQLLSLYSKFSKENPTPAAIIATVIISSSSLVVMPLLPFVDGSARSKRMMKLLVSAAAGGLLGDVFLHILPHAINPHDHSQQHDHHHDSKHAHGHNHLREALVLGLPILSGILVFFVAEKLVSNFTGSGHGHSHALKEPTRKSSRTSASSPPSSPRSPTKSKAKASPVKKSSFSSSSGSNASSFAAVKAAGWLNLAADMMHNFTDGLAIGVAFRSGNGASTTIAVFFHEVPHNVADFGILLQNGFSKKAALVAQFVSALGSLFGCIVGLTLEKVIGLDLFVAGGFIYIATIGVIPDLLDDTNVWHTLQEAFAMCFGIAMMALMLTFE